jgi:LuxR family transcriptional regulator, maltose regulon positive regulatory protein
MGKEGPCRKRELLNLMREAVHYSYANQIVYPYVMEGETVQKILVQLIYEKKSDLLAKERQFV